MEESNQQSKIDIHIGTQRNFVSAQEEIKFIFQAELRNIEDQLENVGLPREI